MSPRFFAALIVAAALFTGCSRTPRPVRASTDSDSVRTAAKRQLAPDFTLKDAAGTSVKLSDYRGKVVLLNFWATWCGPCKVEIPWFMEFENTYKNRDFAVLGVSMDDDGWKSVKPYIETRKINYRVMIGTDELAQLYGGVDSLPTTFIIDRDGRIADHHIGLVGKADYQNEIVNLLDASKTTTRAALDPLR